ncbi:zinc metalloprotease HtpX [Balneolaceae bacterium ANBcel3]|nr:zinc metalloprotease HtpX [Balneolaceae bacterium ANBcel3]
MLKNSMRTVFLMSLVAMLFLFIGNLLGGQTGMVMALMFALAMNGFSYWYSDKLVLKMYRAKEVTRENSPRFYSMVEELAQSANLPMPKVYIIPQEQPNAFATGRNPQNAAVAATQGILRSLTDKELRGVMAHELAHIKNRDILTQTIVTSVVSAISILAQFAIFLPIGRGDGNGPNPLVLLLTLILAPLAAMMLQTAISRTREFEADRVGAEICGSPAALANALRKIQASVQQMPMQASETTQKSTAHMFPVNPFSSRGMSRLFSTHPDTNLRIQKLMKMEETGVYS